MIDRFLIPRFFLVLSLLLLAVWPGASSAALPCFFANRHFPPAHSSARSIDRDTVCAVARSSFPYPIPLPSLLSSTAFECGLVFGHHHNNNNVRTKNDDRRKTTMTTNAFWQDGKLLWHWYDTRNARNARHERHDGSIRTHAWLSWWMK
ncbi:uncharacterized protein BKA78DRAFT_181677 [Phyllosticta capitalensis]|uniref:Secreted protein n=1 Tax=Phyllosticta capitalensis TaxID=121624 RepID=A0ABR1YHA4_9PEZI